ncbi:hypothetical protein Bca4012_063727 [Brassica carinata]
MRLVPEIEEEAKETEAKEKGASFPQAWSMIDFPNFNASLDQADKMFDTRSALRLVRLLHSFGSAFSGVSFTWEDIYKDPLSSTLDTQLVESPTFCDNQLFPHHLFEILLRVTFPATTSTPEEDTTSLLKIYTSLKEVALACALIHEQLPRHMFTLSLRLAGEGNPGLAKEAIEIAIWCMKKVDCWEDWYSMCKENIEASVALLKALVDEWPDLSLKLPSSSSSKQFIQEMFTVSLRLAGEGNPVLAKEATEIAIWSLTENFDCWKHWNSLRSKENLEASVDLLKTLVEKWNEGSLELSLPSTEAMKPFIQEMVDFSLAISKEGIIIFESSSVVPGMPVLLGQASAVAIWSLTEIVDCCKHWDNLYMEILEESGAVLEKLEEICDDHSLKLASSSKSSLLPRLLENPVIGEEAIAIAIWSLTENSDCCTHWEILYKENKEASVALLKILVHEWKDYSLKLSLSPRDTLTLSQTIKSFRLKSYSSSLALKSSSQVWLSSLKSGFQVWLPSLILKSAFSSLAA